MSQAGYTPIQLYYSTTAAAVPLAANLAAGELAINIVDGKLYYENNSGVVTLLASAAGASGDVVGPASATDNAVARFDGTTGKLIQNGVVIVGDTGAVTGVTDLTASGAVTLSGGTANGVAYLNGSKVLTSGSALTFDTNIFTAKGANGGYSLAFDATTTPLIFKSNDLTGASYAPIAFSLGNGSGYLEQMRLTSTGLGIGTSSPSQKLEVAGNAKLTGTNLSIVPSTATSAAYTLNTNTGGNFFLGIDSSTGASFTGTAYGRFLYSGGAYPIVFLTNDTERMRLDSSGNLGLGVTPSAWSTSAQQALQVYTASVSGNGGGNTASRFTHGAYLDGSTWKYQYTGVAPTRYEVTGANAGSTHSWSVAAGGTAGNAITFTQAMTLTAAGLLGVGTTSPSQKIETDGRIRVTSNGTNGGDMAVDQGGLAFSSLSTTPIVFERNSFASESARFDGSGNFGVGTTSPASYGKLVSYNVSGGAYAISVVGNDQSNTRLRIRNTGGADFTIVGGTPGASNAGLAIFDETNSATRMLIDSSGNLLVNTTAVGGKLYVVSDLTSNNGIRIDTPSSFTATNILSLSATAGSTSWNHIAGNGNGGSQTNFIIYGNGNMVNANNSYGAVSDVKLKENIVDASPKLADLMQVKVRNYNLIGETTRQIGVVAQELETVFPSMIDETVDKDQDGNSLGTTTKQVKYSVFVPMLIKAIQEQQAIIESLKARLDAANL